MTLSIGLLNLITRFIHSNKQAVKIDSRLGVFLCEQGYADLGREDALQKSLYFTASDKNKLLSQLTIDFGDKIFSTNLKGANRLEVAKLTSNEKLAGLQVDQQYLLLKCLSSNLTPFLLNDAPEVILPMGSALRCKISQLNLQLIKQVIVIENLIVFDHIEQFIFPEGISDALVVYRGHDNTSKGCVSLLSQLTNHCQVVAFCDYDPAGLQIAITLPNVSHFIYPELNAIKTSKTLIEDLNIINHRDDFFKQHACVDYLLCKAPENSPVLAEHIQLIQLHKLSIKQEHMLAHQMPLGLACLKP